jgi:hypothetical protein
LVMALNIFSCLSLTGIAEMITSRGLSRLT